MAAALASWTGFVPVAHPRVAVTGDGKLASIHEAARVTILALPDAVPFAEIGVDPDADASEVGWVGAPGRLLVLSRYAGHSTVHLLDPHGPRTIAEIRLESPMQLLATAGATALVVGAVGAAALAATETHLTLYPFPTRAVPLAAGAAATQFVVALPAMIEEWDPGSRTPKRRLRLPRAAAITAVGGSERLVWMTTQQQPARIDVIPIVNRGQPRAHDLPEPIAHLSGHPRSDLLACIGAETGRLYVLDLDGRIPTRVIEPDGIDRIAAAALVIGRSPAVLVAQAGRPIAIISLDRRDAEPTSVATIEPLVADDASGGAGDAVDAGTPPAHEEAQPTASPHEPPSPDLPALTSLYVPAEPPPSELPDATSSWYAPAEPAPSPSAETPSAKPSAPAPAWRDQVRQPRAAPIPAAVPVSTGARPPVEARHSWRDEIVAWSRGALDHPPPAAPAIDAVIARFDLALRIQPVITLLYGAHLCGEPGVPPVEIARALDRQWDEALGRGELAQYGVALYAGSRVALSPVVLRMLDELPPLTGIIVGEPGAIALLGPCAVVAGDEPIVAIAMRCLAHVGGAILAAHDGVDRRALAFEARACGAVPMLRTSTVDATSSAPLIAIVDDTDRADRLGVPRLA